MKPSREQTNGSGWRAVDRDDREVDYSSFVAARARSLLRLAYLVTGDGEQARRLLESALAHAHVDWWRIGGRDQAEEYVRRWMLADHRARSPRSREEVASQEPGGRTFGARDGHSALVEVRGAESPGPAGQGQRPDPWPAFAEVSPRERAILVLAVDDGLADDEISRLVGARASIVRTERQRGWSAWSRALAAQNSRPGRTATDKAQRFSAAVDPEEVAALRSVLALHAEDVRPELDLAERAQRGAKAVRTRRRRRNLVVAAGVVAVIGLTATLSATLGGDANDVRGLVAGSPSGSGLAPIPSVVPEAVLELARSDHALLGYGPVIVDGGATDVIVVDADPPNGVLHGLRVEALARAAGGYVVRLGALRDDGADVANPKLAYVDRRGTKIDLGRVSIREPNFSVSADGLEVVHVIRGPVDSENALTRGQSELVVQTLGGSVVNRMAVTGPIRPLGVDADRVWFEHIGADGSPRGLPYFWDRQDSSVRRMSGTAGWVAQDLQGELMVVRDSRGCLRGLDIRDPEDPQRLWRHCVISQGVRISPTAEYVSEVGTSISAPLLITLDARTGRGVDRGPVTPGVVGQLEWTAAGRVVLAIDQGPISRGAPSDAPGVVYTVVQRTGPSGGEVVVARTITGLSQRLVVGRELPLPRVATP